MFTVFDIPWVIEADTAETRKQYEKSWPDPCDCGSCRNFSEAVNLLPAEKNKIVYAVWDSSGCLSRLGGAWKGKRPASLCGQLSDCRHA